MFHFAGSHRRLSHGELATDLLFQAGEDQIRSQQDVRDYFGNEPSTENNSKMSAFNDWSFYQALQQQPGCTHVRLSQIDIDHSSWFLTGLQVTYESMLHGTTVEAKAPQHDFQRFRYRQYGQSTKSTLRLLEEEYIVNLAVRRVDKISDRITIVTNLRHVSFGSPDFSCYSTGFLVERHPNQQHNLQRRVVALAGVTMEMSEQVGCFSESLNWETLKDWILMRSLVETQRAQPMKDTTAPANTNDKMIQSLVVEANDDIFKRVLSFLVDG